MRPALKHDEKLPQKVKARRPTNGPVKNPSDKLRSLNRPNLTVETGVPSHQQQGLS